MPHLYPRFFVANSKQGVGTSPAFLQSNPEKFNAVQIASAIIGLESRPS